MSWSVFSRQNLYPFQLVLQEKTLPLQQSFRTSTGSKTSAKSWQFDLSAFCSLWYAASFIAHLKPFAKCNHIVWEMDCLDQPQLFSSWYVVSYKFLSVKLGHSVAYGRHRLRVDVWIHRLYIYLDMFILCQLEHWLMLLNQAMPSSGMFQVVFCQTKTSLPCVYL